MTDQARHALIQALLKLDERLPLDGWEHYFSAIGDDGRGALHFDRASEDGTGWLVIVTGGGSGPRVDLERSYFAELLK